MIALDYQIQGDQEGIAESLRNIFLAHSHLRSPDNPFQELVRLQKSWERLMTHFADEAMAADVRGRLLMQ